MSSWIEVIEWVSLLSGIAYVLLEIGQHNAMWLVGIVTGAACAVSFLWQHAWASTGLNIYYVGVSFWGLWQWRRDKAAAEGGGDAILIRRPTIPVVLLSAVLLAGGTPLLAWGLSASGDPAPWLDGFALTLSAIATWWLGRSYPQQWLMWIVADAVSTGLCIALGRYLMVALYAVYTVSAVYGYFHWIHKGKKIV